MDDDEKASPAEQEQGPCGLMTSVDLDAGAAPVVRDHSGGSGTREALGPDGRELWDELIGDRDVPMIERVLVTQACRITDTLAHLARVQDADGQTWAFISLPDREGVAMVLQIGNVLVEARAQATTLRQLIGQIEQSRRAKKEGDDDGPGTDPAAEFQRRQRERAERAAAEQAAARAGGGPAPAHPHRAG